MTSTLHNLAASLLAGPIYGTTLRTMVAAYLWINAAIYLLFSLWCTFRPTQTAAASGFLALDNSGRSEYLVVYGGLQLGLAAFFALLAVTPDLHRLGLLFSLAIYVAIVAYRVVTVIVYRPVSSVTLGIAGLEVALLVAAFLLWWLRRPH